MYNQYTVNNVKVNVVEGKLKNLKLLQVSGDKAKLSQLRYGTEKPYAIINCSYFDKWVLGRNQGDIRNDTSSWTEQAYLGFSKTDDYKSGKMEFWDIGQSDCGFTPATICVQEGKDVELCSNGLGISFANKMSLATGVSFFGIMKNKNVLLITAEKGITGYLVAKWIKEHWDMEFLCELDGGGSTEMIVEGNIVQKSTDGTERPMFNGLALIDEEGFKPRTSELNPSDMNTSPYYNSPMYVGKNNFYKGNTNYQCVAYANARSSEIAKKPITYWNGTSQKEDIEKPIFNRYGFGDAKNWLEDTNWQTGTVARVGAIMVYGTNYGGGLGHVRIVEKIEGNKITYSGANENKKLAFNTIDIPKLSDHDFMGYIYNPYIECDPEEDLKAEIEKLKAEIEYLQHNYDNLLIDVDIMNKKLAKIKEVVNE